MVIPEPATKVSNRDGQNVRMLELQSGSLRVATNSQVDSEAGPSLEDYKGLRPALLAPSESFALAMNPDQGYAYLSLAGTSRTSD